MQIGSTPLADSQTALGPHASDRLQGLYPASDVPDAVSGVTKNDSVVASSDASRLGVVWNVVVVAAAVVGLNFLWAVVVVVDGDDGVVVAVASGSSSSSSSS